MQEHPYQYTSPRWTLCLALATATALSALATRPIAAAQRVQVARESYAVVSYRDCVGTVSDLRSQLWTQLIAERAAKDDVTRYQSEVVRIEGDLQAVFSGKEIPNEAQQMLTEARAKALEANRQLGSISTRLSNTRRELHKNEETLLDFLRTMVRLQAEGRVPTLKNDPFFGRELRQLDGEIGIVQTHLRDCAASHQQSEREQNRQKELIARIRAGGPDAAESDAHLLQKAEIRVGAIQEDLEELTLLKVHLNESLRWYRRLRSAVQALHSPTPPKKVSPRHTPRSNHK